jgi:hypothetical protein
MNEATSYIFYELKEKLIARITKIVVQKNVYKIALTICRHETMAEEMKLRL